MNPFTVPFLHHIMTDMWPHTTIENGELYIELMTSFDAFDAEDGLAEDMENVAVYRFPLKEFIKVLWEDTTYLDIDSQNIYRDYFQELADNFTRVAKERKEIENKWAEQAKEKARTENPF